MHCKGNTFDKLQKICGSCKGEVGKGSGQMPILGIKDCRGGTPRSGIPVRVAPQNICDVNPYLCRMTPASINFNAEKPFVGKLSFEPHPRGCQCCAKAQERESHHHYQTPSSRSPQSILGYDRPVRELSMTCQGVCDTARQRPPEATPDPVYRTNPQLDRYASVQSQKVGKLSKGEKKKAQKEKAARKKKENQQKARQQKKRKPSLDYERIRLLREEIRKDNFVTACCTGLLLTPCVSAGSCSEEADDREQANFYIQCKCCPGTHGGNECQASKRRRGKHADFPCQCRNCKYQDKGCGNLKRGYIEQPTTESPVCYCSEEEKKEYRPYRICNDEARQKGGFLNSVIEGGKALFNSPCETRDSKEGKRGAFSPNRVCDGMLPTGAGLLTSNKDNEDACTKMVMTVEMIQDMLIKQAQQGIELANSLLTNKKFQLVDVNAAESQGGQVHYRSQPIQTSRTEQKSQFMQTSRSHQQVELNEPRLKCCLQDVTLPDVTSSGLETGKIWLEDPLPMPPPYPSETCTSGQENYYNAPLDVNLSGKNWSYPMTQPMPQPGQYKKRNETVESQYGYGYHGPNGTYMGVGLTTPKHQQGPQNGITGHICIPKDALYQDPTSPKLCIPLSFDPRMPMESANCPFMSDHVQDKGVQEPVIMARSDSQKELQRGGSMPGLKQGSRHALQKEDSRLLEPELSKHRSRSDNIPRGSRRDRTQHMGTKLFLIDSSQPELQMKNSGQGLPKESGRMAQTDHGRIPDRFATTSMQQVSSWDEIEARHMKARELQGRPRQVFISVEQMDAEGIKARESSERLTQLGEQMEAREPRKRTRQQQPDRERRKRDSGWERRDRSPPRRMRSDSSPERSHRRRRSDDPTREPNHRPRRKRSPSPCEDASDVTLRKGDPTRQRRPSRSEMVSTLNGYETDLLQAMDNVKEKYLKKRGNETSSSKVRSYRRLP